MDEVEFDDFYTTSYARVVGQVYAMVVGKLVLQATEHQQSPLAIGLINGNPLEAAIQGRIPFEVALVLRPCGGGDGAHAAPGQGRLEQVGGIVLTGVAAGTDEGMGLIDKENDRRG